ncbi:ribonuclease J [Candidatus Parcubacteria bacterium]|nr:ribonuclease J [Patescibacteria group bacterium]MCG2694062.1 ribonuclease J [Candidatus Parcubacteria bacterium]
MIEGKKINKRPKRQRVQRSFDRKSAGNANKLRIIPLGGLEEIGRNCTIFEYGDDIVIVDIGLQFPEEDMPGIDYIIPDFDYLKDKSKKIRGVIITHGHYDHIGGIPHLMAKIGNPVIYTAPLTAGIIKKRQEEFRDAPPLKIQNVKIGDKIRLGVFTFEPYHINHNIFDAFGVALNTPLGYVVTTGDFKFDFTPVNDEPADLTQIAMYGTKKVLALMSDSTNAESPGYQISESEINHDMDKIFEDAKSRIIVGTFSSLLTRVQQLISLAEKYDRHVLIQGRSMKNNIEIAHSLGYMKVKPHTIIEEKDFKNIPDEKLVVICTGAQGEKNAVLMRVANNEHRIIKIQKGDTIVFSSSVIPGNERTVQHLKDSLVRHGAKVIHYQMMDVHAGGHAKQEDLKLMMRLIKPEYFIPIHGNRYLLEMHANLAEKTGIPREKIFVASNGQIISFDRRGGRLTQEKVPSDYVMVDGLGYADSNEVVLRDRRQLAEDGMFVVIVTIDTKTGELVGNPDIISRGFVYLKEHKPLIEQARTKVKHLLKDTDPTSPTFEDYLKNKIRNEIGQFLWKKTKKRPMILPVLIEV